MTKNKIVIHDTNNQEMRTKLSTSELRKVKIHEEGDHNAKFSSNGVKIEKAKTEIKTFLKFGIPTVKILANVSSTKTLFTN